MALNFADPQFKARWDADGLERRNQDERKIEKVPHASRFTEEFYSAFDSFKEEARERIEKKEEKKNLLK